MFSHFLRDAHNKWGAPLSEGNPNDCRTEQDRSNQVFGCDAEAEINRFATRGDTDHAADNHRCSNDRHEFTQGLASASPVHGYPNRAKRCC